MAKLIILQGPPCSGKSTWADSYLHDHIHEKIMIINRDTIRMAIGKGKYTMDHEDEVTKRENSLMEYASKNDFSIIQDATNLNPKTIKKLEEWASENNYSLEYRKFYVPYVEAMKRSKARKEAGGLYISKEVMKRFYLKYYEKEFREEMTDPKIAESNKAWEEGKLKPECIICDLDGTLALHNGRDPFEYDKIPTDIIDCRLYAILFCCLRRGVELIFLTGRPESERAKTEEWLMKTFPKFKLLMRKTSDFRPGDEYKKEVYNTEIKGNYFVLGAFEDSQKCIDMWKNEGVLCFAVANNDY